MYYFDMEKKTWTQHQRGN